MVDLHAMLQGPGRLRFIIQPLVAILLGLRDGKVDLQMGNPPFLWALITSGDRKQLGARAFKQIAVPLALAIAMDGIFQYVIFKAVSPLSALLVGALLIALPYSISRALTNRTLRHSRLRQTRLRHG